MFYCFEYGLMTYQKHCKASIISATEGQRLLNMTVSTLQSIRSEEDFNMFWQRVEEKEA